MPSMASPAAERRPSPPSADPREIRAALGPVLAAEFDHEWETVLDRVKQSMDLADLHGLLTKWRHTAYMELCEPGSYQRLLAKADEILATGHHPDAVPFEQMQAVIRRRQGR